MKAQLLSDFGSAHQLAAADVPTPEAGAGNVRVRVRAIGINPMDVKIRSGSLQDEMKTELPAILGSDIAGEVDQVGDGVRGLSVGDRVVGLALDGAYAEYAIARAGVVALIPDGLDFEHAATIPTAGETARRVIGMVAATRGETVVVNGAVGSVGSAAVQLLVRDGLRVIGTAGKDNHDYVRRLGAEPTTYGDGVVDRIRGLAPDGVDAVFDVTDHGFVDAAIELRGGTERIVTISDFAAGEKGVTVSSGDASTITKESFAPIIELAAAGDFVTEIAQVFEFDEIPAAHELSEGGHLRGKIIVRGPR